VAAYLAPPLVLAFGPMQDARSGRTSAPWDTRGLRSILACDEADHARHIAEHSIPAPDDETYLAHYLARCFDSLHMWLDGQRPTGLDVLGVLGMLRNHDYNAGRGQSGTDEDMLPATTPEARFTANVDLSSLLLAAFVNVDYPIGRADEDGWAKTYRALEGLLGDDFYRLRGDVGIPDLRGAAYRFVRRHLEHEGMR